MHLNFARGLVAAWLVTGLVGCGGASTGDAEDQLVVRTTPHQLAPGEETYLCQYFPPSGPARWIDAIDVDETEGLHHLLVFHLPDVGSPRTELSPCTDDQSGASRGVLPIVKPGGSFTMPPGVATAIAADEGLLVQLHMLNTSAVPLEVAVTWRAHTVPASRVEKPAGMFFFGMGDIDLPPHRETTVSKTCSAPIDVEMFEAAGHFHTHEIAYRATIAGVPVVEGVRVDGGARASFDPPRAVHAGDPISWSCTDLNTGATDVRSGPSFLKNEMCNFAAYVFPVSDSKTFGCE